jgi:hypothetical protein
MRRTPARAASFEDRGERIPFKVNASVILTASGVRAALFLARPTVKIQSNRRYMRRTSVAAK